jgi:ribosome-interacting GTPase 1
MRFGTFDLSVAAEALGMTEDELRTALEEDGTSIADVAADQGVEVQKVVDALVADANARIDKAVTDGDLEADRAEELKSGLADRITEMVNGEFRGDRGGRAGPFGGHGRGIGGADLGVAAEALGMTEDELRTALEEDGKSIADVAADKDVDPQKVIDALVASATENLEERITDIVNGEFEGKPGD